MRWVAIMLTAGVLGFPAPLSPSPTNPLCYNSPAYRNTHEQECLITPVQGSNRPRPGGGSGGSGTIRDILRDLSGGLIG